MGQNDKFAAENSRRKGGIRERHSTNFCEKDSGNFEQQRLMHLESNC
jgi:hypothetical protein